MYSVELSESAVRDARENIRQNAIDNVVTICDRVERFLETFQKSGEAPDALVVDPPRDGLHPDAIEPILGFGSRVIVYVSCNPATLARDLARLLDLGAYRITDVAPVDMFAHTHHIETVVRMERVFRG